jgi:hypothetical protein
MNAPRIRRWVEGYSYKSRAGDERQSSPLFRRERGGSERIFTFIDLVEILFVKTFLDQSVSMRTIRLVQKEAAEEFKVRHPFRMKRFETDGETILERFNRRAVSARGRTRGIGPRAPSIDEGRRPVGRARAR